MQFRFLWIGKTKNQHFAALEDDYAGRLGKFVKCEFTILRDGPDKETEGKRILEKLNLHGTADVILYAVRKGFIR